LFHKLREGSKGCDKNPEGRTRRLQQTG
jgi:hypothetical protein